MRYKNDQKSVSRQRILDAASRRFKADGVAASGLAAVMEDAGLTNGAFYTHFGSKDDLVREALSVALQEQLSSTPDPCGADALLEILRTYLSAGHTKNPSLGCPSAALLPEIARSPLGTRREYEEAVGRWVDKLSSGVGGDVVARRRAMALFCLAVGALQVSRAVASDEFSDFARTSAVDTAQALLKG
ncbi:TetR/AcrR family transcriptional regulator [Rhizobium deserti]|uniref:TetR/AcrR family transcriptional regulator n=1 Tax=Rhizobium deserti TaxID=2547961 RepID=A0A4R5UN95_9HYPH|nr:TetR/AcrR family transcriptional regulator [Rhizobium deserti]TDK39238.1 TetR/AcrR family transcriptional regulator [Rhizobium deserti]